MHLSTCHCGAAEIDVANSRTRELFTQDLPEHLQRRNPWFDLYHQNVYYRQVKIFSLGDARPFPYFLLISMSAGIPVHFFRLSSSNC
jgi:hypothetical protein